MVSVEFIENCCAMSGKAGAMMVDTMMRLKPVAESTSVTAHLRRIRQFLGFEVSFSPEKVTRKGSSSLLAGEC